MLLIDTSAWIEWLVDSRTGKSIGMQVTQRTLLVPTIVQFELVKWLGREAPTRIGEVLDFTSKCVIANLDTPLALRAAEVAKTSRLAAADAIIYATAAAHGADLLTCDAHFAELAGVIYVPKSAP